MKTGFTWTKICPALPCLPSMKRKEILHVQKLICLPGLRINEKRSYMCRNLPARIGLRRVWVDISWDWILSFRSCCLKIELNSCEVYLHLPVPPQHNNTFQTTLKQTNKTQTRPDQTTHTIPDQARQNSYQTRHSFKHGAAPRQDSDSYSAAQVAMGGGGGRDLDTDWK